ncbi:hypothetical protein B0H14DRAFT_2609455 [Mycena olivaceomarginata]|nr:hypothetical protein B0H14DRAFT_2609455 [Mycena olivaceomarginata]
MVSISPSWYLNALWIWCIPLFTASRPKQAAEKSEPQESFVVLSRAVAGSPFRVGAEVILTGRMIEMVKFVKKDGHSVWVNEKWAERNSDGKCLVLVLKWMVDLVVGGADGPEIERDTARQVLKMKGFLPVSQGSDPFGVESGPKTVCPIIMRTQSGREPEYGNAQNWEIWIRPLSA